MSKALSELRETDDDIERLSDELADLVHKRGLIYDELTPEELAEYQTEEEW